MLRLGWATGSCRGLDGLGETSAADQTDFGKLSLEKAFGESTGLPSKGENLFSPFSCILLLWQNWLISLNQSVKNRNT